MHDLLKGNLNMAPLIIAALLISQPAHTEELKITKIKDGDTVEITLPGLPKQLGNTIPLRIQRIDTPELKGKCDEEKNKAREAKDFLTAKIKESQTVEVLLIKRDKYFRVVGDILLDGQLASDLLIKHNLAMRYDGGAKAQWCGNSKDK